MSSHRYKSVKNVTIPPWYCRKMLSVVALFDCHRSRFIFTSRGEMNLQLAAIFFCGIVFSLFLEPLKDYLRWKYVRNDDYRKFAALPDENQLRIVEEGDTSIYIKGPEKDRKKPEGKPIRWNWKIRNGSFDICDPGSYKEAISSLSAALEMKSEGKHDKAMKLFQHAAVLAPKHPDILNYYGEFLEETQNDIMLADQLYFQALMYSPDHTKALSNRQRTAALVEEMDRDMLNRIDSKRDQISAVPDSNKGLRRAKKEAYFQVCKLGFVSKIRIYTYIYISCSIFIIPLELKGTQCPSHRQGQ